MPVSIRTLGLTIVVAAAIAQGACTHPDTSPVGTPSLPQVPASTTTSPSPATPQQQVLDTYLGMQRAFQKAGETADPDNPDLPRFTAGRSLELLTTGLATMRGNGLRSRGETIFHPVVESLDPPAAPTRSRVRDCMDTRGAEAFKANGDPYTDTPGGFRIAIADLERTGDTWKVTGLGIHGVGSCAR